MAKTLGTWEFLGQIGQGAQSQVFHVRSLNSGVTGGPWALKRLSNSTSSKARLRFVREIEALKRIDHPSIVRPLEASPTDFDPPYYVMPLEEGARPLSKIISADDSPYRDNALACLQFVALCSRALSVAHAAQVIHRDLKPDNILVKADGTPLIIDFGCCLLMDDEGVVTLTDEGVGARNFMAPECEAGTEGATAPNSDVYSLGKILWCMMTGQRPFARETPGFTNKLVTDSSRSPYAGFIVDAMLASVRTSTTNRVATATEFAAICDSYCAQIQGHKGHVSYLAPRCPACLSIDVKASNDTIGPPLELNVATFIGNTSNNPYLKAKFCQTCGNVSLHDFRLHDAFVQRVQQAKSR